MAAIISRQPCCLDLLHPEISGNKWFKLRYNLDEAKASGKTHIVTFGGAWSNHIAATAAACHAAGFVLHGHYQGKAAPVLEPYTGAGAAVMACICTFVSRDTYRQRSAIDWEARYPGSFIIPEGRHNAAGAMGCKEILPWFPMRTLPISPVR